MGLCSWDELCKFQAVYRFVMQCFSCGLVGQMHSLEGEVARTPAVLGPTAWLVGALVVEVAAPVLAYGCNASAVQQLLMVCSMSVSG